MGCCCRKTSRDFRKRLSRVSAIDDSHSHIELEIDGGVNFENIESILEAGADVIVAGTTTFTGGEKEYANNIAKLRG